MSITTQAVKDINVPAFANNMSVANMLSGMSQKFQARPAQPVKDAVEQDDFENNKSIDERAFSDFGIDGSEKDYKQDGRVKANNAYWMQDKEQDKVDDVELAANEAQEFMEEKRRERLQEMYSTNFMGYDLDEEEIQEASKKGLKTLGSDAKERGWDEEKTENMRAILMVLSSSDATNEERDQALKDMKNIDPNYAEEWAKEADHAESIREAKTSLVAQELREENRRNDIVARINSNNDIIDRPDSQITSIFKKEAEGVGTKKNSISVNKNSPEEYAPKEKDPFILDV